MIWIILLVLLSLIFMTAGFSAYKDTSDCLFAVCVGCACIFIAWMIVYQSNSSSIDLASERQKVVTEQKAIEQIRGSYYESKNNTSPISGSIENFTPILSNYIRDVTIDKANYNALLITYKLKMNNSFYWWLGGAAFYNKEEINQLEMIKE